MHGEMDLATINPAIYAAHCAQADDSWDAQPLVSRGPITPPRLQALDPGATRAVPRLTVADLRLPVNVVRERAGQYADYARAQGTRHSMRLWRHCYRQAILALAREASHVAPTTPCAALFWEQKGGEYWIAATFGHASVPQLH